MDMIFDGLSSSFVSLSFALFSFITFIFIHDETVLPLFILTVIFILAVPVFFAVIFPLWEKRFH